jgi:hypothetical protein
MYHIFSFGFFFVFLFLKVHAVPPEIYCAPRRRAAPQSIAPILELSTRRRAAPRFFHRASRPKILAPRHAAPLRARARRARAARARTFESSKSAAVVRD